MLFSRVASLLLAVEAAVAAPAYVSRITLRGGNHTDLDLSVKRATGFNWGSDTIRGVNIGGWLVLEPWITPSIFQNVDQSLGIVDEYTLCQKLPDQAPQILRDHWNSWARFDDFQRIAKAGFNLVRIPIGFWAYDNSDTPYVSGAAEYMDAAIDWARGAGLKVIIDLHGAPGSQNGFDNSGQRLPPTNLGWQQGDTIKRTLAVLQNIADKYAQQSYQDVVVGIELLNEPLSKNLNVDEIKQFYRDGYGEVRTVSDTTVILHDAFLAPSSWNGFLSPSDDNARRVAIDHHEYQVFTNELVALQPWQHRQAVCDRAASYSGADKWTFIGEWSAAMTDCAAALNGYGIGARYEGYYPGSTHVGSCATINFIETWDDTFKNDMRGYVEAQMEVFEAKTNGWIFWNFKTEASPEWDLFRLLDVGVFPQPLSDRRFGAICA